jgi:hypothetical protein
LKNKTKLGKNEGSYPADGMDRVDRQTLCRQKRAVRQPGYVATVRRYLPQVVADDAELDELAQRQNLAKSPLIGEGLAGRFKGVIRALPVPVNFPIGEDAGADAFVLSQVQRGSGCEMISKVPSPNIVSKQMVCKLLLDHVRLSRALWWSVQF